MPTVLVANAISCSRSTESPVLLDAISSSLANADASFTAAPTAAATANVAAAAAAAPLVKFENDLSVFLTEPSSASSFLSVLVRALSSFAVLASSSTISFSVAIHHHHRAIFAWLRLVFVRS
ncbi:MAG TPA: hypothetical protein EYN54_11160 [Methylococcaceae bacterium]|nr:hypothetical protein [Methylococcaceae bacterium]